MPVDFYIVVIPFCAIPVLLVSIDYLNKSTEFDKQKNNIIDFDKFIKRKQEGDVVDNDIANLIDIDNIAA